MQQPKEYTEQLQAYKAAIDADIAAYARHAMQTTRNEYGNYAADVADVYFDLLSRGGKRIRGALVMTGYRMCGGSDEQMIVRAATALEMLNAYILMIDDIQDRSLLRRGKATAHMMLTDYHHAKGLKGDAKHSGMSLTLNAALAGAHAAQMLLAGLQVDAELRMKVVGIVNLAMLVTAHGQTSDLINELTGDVAAADIEHVLEWKTAYYTFLNPLCVGMVLAGAGCEDTDAIREYALHAGKAFQITDDIIGVFGSEEQTGKSIMDDIREGKQTILTNYAFAHIAQEDADFLRTMLGNEQLTEEQFARCREILEASGARQHASQVAEEHIEKALQSLAMYAHRWNAADVAFLRGLAQSLQGRTA